jgi:lipoyl(octanoyl) transferase
VKRDDVLEPPPQPPALNGAPPAAGTLQAYLLGTVPFEDALALQRRLAFEVAGDRGRGALLLCEHPPLITVGRQGSHAHLLCGPDELRARQWRVRWVNRGGGCVLHQPGQLAVYPVVALDRLGLSLPAYLERLQDVVLGLLDDLSLTGTTHPGQPGVWVRGRLLAAVGVAVRGWVTSFGIVLNVNPALTPFRLVRCGGPGEPPMTSLERERHGPVRPAFVRQRVLELMAARLGFAETHLFTDHPSLRRKAADACTARP